MVASARPAAVVKPTPADVQARVEQFQVQLAHSFHDARDWVNTNLPGPVGGAVNDALYLVRRLVLPTGEHVGMFGTAECVAAKDCSGKDLTGVQLHDQDLGEVDWTGVNLTHANFRNADFNASAGPVPAASRTVTANADVFDDQGKPNFKPPRDFSNANLTGADFRGANLNGANFTNANLANANLTGANLTGANLTGANLTNANLADAKLPPTVSSISPAIGVSDTSTAGIILSGDFFTGATSVTFGGTKATFTVQSDTLINATAPSQSPGLVDVVVTTPYGTATLAGGFTYLAAPTIFSISPNEGPLNTTVPGVVITGTNFNSVTTVAFGGVPGTSVVVNSATRLTVTAPSKASAGAVIVTVTTPGGFTTLVNGFTYRSQ